MGREHRRKIADLPGLSAHPQQIILSPDERNVVYGSNSAVDVWSLETGENLLRRLSSTVRLTGDNGVTFTATGELVYISDSNDTRGLWIADLKSGRFEQVSDGFIGRDLTFNARGDWLITSASPLRLWYLPERVLDAVYPHESTTAAAFHPDGLSYASGGSVVRIWDFETRKLTQAVGENFGNVTALRYNDSGTRLASVHSFVNEEDNSQHWRVVLWDTDGYQPLLTLEDRLEPLVFQPGGERLLVHKCTSSPSRGHICESWAAHIVDTTTGETLYTLPYELNSPIFSADGSLLFGGALDGNLAVLDAESGMELARYSSHRGRIYVALSPDAHTIVTMASGQTESGASGIGWVWGVPIDD